MVPPTMFVSGAIAVLHVCNEVYTRFRGVKRFREDCEKLAHFVHRIESFITETEDDADMSGPGWEAAFGALHESLLEVVAVFDDCARYGMVRSMLNADDLNLRLNAISQRLTLSLQLIPIQKTKAMDKRLVELQSIQAEIRTAAFTAVRAAEEQSASLKRLMDQSRVDTNKTHEMLEQVLLLLQSDPCARGTSAAKTAAGPGPASQGGTFPLQQQQQDQQAGAAAAVVYVDVSQLEAELADLHVELKFAVQNKNVTEEQYLEQVIEAISAMESQMQQAASRRRPDPSVDLRCPITCQLLVDPVILVDSAQTYERGAIQEWLDRGNRKDPVTGVMLSSTLLVPNIAVRKMAEDWLVANGLPPSDSLHLLQQRHSGAAPSRPTPQQQQAVAEDASCSEKATAAAAQQKCACKPEPAHEDEDKDDAFALNPKTAAILAAGASAGFCSPFEDAAAKPQQLSSALFTSSSSSNKGCCSQDAADQHEKQLAQQAYARAVAAAAAGSAATGGGTAVVAMAVGAAGSGDPFNSSSSGNSSISLSGAAAAGGSSGGVHADQRERQFSVASSIGDGSRASSITLARAGSSRTLPSFSHQLQQQQRPEGRDSLDRAGSGLVRISPIRDGPEDRSVQFCPWPAATAAPAAAVQSPRHVTFEQQPSFRQPSPSALGQAGGSATQQQQQQQQQQSPRHPSPQHSSSPFADGRTQMRFFPLNSMSMGTRSRQERAVAAAAAAAAMVAQQQHGSFRLQDLHGTLGRAAETRYRMSLRHSSPAAAEAVLSEQQQIQQERTQHQQEGAAAEERQYLQQHMERLMRSQSPERVRRFSTSHTVSPSPSPGHQRPGQAVDSCSLSTPIPSIPCAPNSSSSSGGAAYADHRKSADFATTAPPALLESHSDSAGVRGRAGSRYGLAPPAAGLAGTAARSAPASVASDLCGSSAPKQGSGLSVLSFARLRQQPVERQSSSGFDDRASVCSSSSSSSRRSVGKNLLGALKSLKYSMVYDDDKV